MHFKEGKGYWWDNSTEAEKQIANKQMTKCSISLAMSEIQIIPQWDTLA